MTFIKFVFVRLTIVHIPTPAVTTMSINSVCPECGTMKKSGKFSCCGSGGSWFGNCGSARDINAGHTFYEGIRACKERQIQPARVQQVHVSQAKDTIFSDDVRAPAWNGTILLPDSAAKMKSMARECGKLLQVVTHASSILIVGVLAN